VLSKTFSKIKLYVWFFINLKFSDKLISITAFEKLPKEFISNCDNKISLSEKFAQQILSWKFYSNCEMNSGNYSTAEIFLVLFLISQKKYA